MAFEKPTNEQLDRRYNHIRPTPEQGDRMSEMRTEIAKVAKFCVARTPCSPEQTRALNALDEAMFLFNAAIARNEQQEPRSDKKVV